MDRMKTFFIYAILIIAFFIFSNFVIFLGLNSNYDNMSPKGEISRQIEIEKAEATQANGRIYGTVKNDVENNISGKYLKADVYSERNILLKTEYYEIGNIPSDGAKDFEIYFRAENAKIYDISIVDEKK